jgi:hypothetical protein
VAITLMSPATGVRNELPDGVTAYLESVGLPTKYNLSHMPRNMSTSQNGVFGLYTVKRIVTILSYFMISVDINNS